MEALKEISGRDYCIYVCPIGKAKSAELLDACESAWDAAMDMHAFVDMCEKTCIKTRVFKSDSTEKALKDTSTSDEKQPVTPFADNFEYSEYVDDFQKDLILEQREQM